MTEEKISINNLGVSYKIAGEGPAILILHGWGSSSNSWEEIQELLAVKDYKIYVLDLPGFGKTKAPSRPWSIDDYVELIKQFSEKQNFSQFFLFGHSFGGRIAIKFAAKYPEQISGLILCSAAGITPRPKLKITFFSFISKIGNLIFSFSLLRPFRDLAKKTAYFLSQTRDYQFIQAPVMKETFKKTIEENLTAYLNQIKVKTLIIWGDKDVMTPISDAYKMNKEIKGSVLRIIPNAKHGIHLQFPEKLSEIILNFLNQKNTEGNPL